MARKKSRKVKKVERNYLDMIPVHSEDRPWKQMSDSKIEIEMENKGFYNRIAQKFFHKPKTSHILLDGHGSALWLMIDGKASIYDIERSMEEKFPDEAGDMLKRVINFMITLERNGFIKLKTS